MSEPATRKSPSKVELARTKMPWVVEVGVSALAKASCQAPEAPAEVLVMVIEPAPFWMEIPAPALRVAAVGAAPEEPSVFLLVLVFLGKLSSQ